MGEPSINRPISLDAKIGLLRRGVATNPHSPTILLRLAEALAEKGEAKEAADIFRRAYLLKPFLWFGRPGSNPQNLRDEAAAMIEHGAIFSSTIAALAIGEARLGHAKEVKRLVDYDRFFRDTVLEAPSGFDLAGFNAALATEIKSNIRFYGEAEGRAIRNAWRDNSVMRSKGPACCAFAAAIRQEVERYIANLPKSYGPSLHEIMSGGFRTCRLGRCVGWGEPSSKPYSYLRLGERSSITSWSRRVPASPAASKAGCILGRRRTEVCPPNKVGPNV